MSFYRWKLNFSAFLFFLVCFRIVKLKTSMLPDVLSPSHTLGACLSTFLTCCFTCTLPLLTTTSCTPVSLPRSGLHHIGGLKPPYFSIKSTVVLRSQTLCLSLCSPHCSKCHTGGKCGQQTRNLQQRFPRQLPSILPKPDHDLHCLLTKMMADDDTEAFLHMFECTMDREGWQKWD